jgi:hypothetical protein
MSNTSTTNLENSFRFRIFASFWFMSAAYIAAEFLYSNLFDDLGSESLQALSYFQLLKTSLDYVFSPANTTHPPFVLALWGGVFASGLLTFYFSRKSNFCRKNSKTYQHGILIPILSTLACLLPVLWTEAFLSILRTGDMPFFFTAIVSPIPFSMFALAFSAPITIPVGLVAAYSLQCIQSRFLERK